MYFRFIFILFSLEFQDSFRTRIQPMQKANELIEDLGEFNNLTSLIIFGNRQKQ